jgi:hypothetical protein
MKYLGVVVVVLALPMSARADILRSGALSVGANFGAHDHHDDASATLGADVDGELQFGMFTVGGSLGRDEYALLNGAPVHAATIAGRAGIVLPLAETSPNNAGRIRKYVGIGALEGGVHQYSPEGERKEFLGGTNTYVGDTRSRTFVGLRTGVEVAIQRPKSTSAVILKLELVGRHDLRSAALEYDKVSCGGLFSDANDCSDPSHGMTRAGGSELGITTSIGVQFGGS